MSNKSNNHFGTHIAIRHKPTGLFLEKYVNTRGQALGAGGYKVNVVKPLLSPIPRFYSNIKSANTVLSRITRTNQENRQHKVKSLLYGHDSCRDYEIVEINLTWTINQPKENNE